MEIHGRYRYIALWWLRFTQWSQLCSHIIYNYSLFCSLVGSVILSIYTSDVYHIYHVYSITWYPLKNFHLSHGYPIESLKKPWRSHVSFNVHPMISPSPIPIPSSSRPRATSWAVPWWSTTSREDVSPAASSRRRWELGKRWGKTVKTGVHHEKMMI